MRRPRPDELTGGSLTRRECRGVGSGCPRAGIAPPPCWPRIDALIPAHESEALMAYEVGFQGVSTVEPAELAAHFKFARQRSKLAGTIRGSYFVIKGEY